TNIPNLVKELAAIDGITFTLTFDKKINGRLRLDFRAPPETVAPVAKLLVGEALDALGTPMLDVQNWSSITKGNSVIMEGDMSDRDLRKLCALLLPAPDTLRASQGGGATGTSQDAETTRKYFRSVATLSEDLQNENAKSFGKLAGLFGQYAKKIE